MTTLPPPCSTWCPFLTHCSSCAYRGGNSPAAQGDTEGARSDSRTGERVDYGHGTRVSPHLQQQAGDVAELQPLDEEFDTMSLATPAPARNPRGRSDG